MLQHLHFWSHLILVLTHNPCPSCQPPSWSVTGLSHQNPAPTPFKSAPHACSFVTEYPQTRHTSCLDNDKALLDPVMACGKDLMWFSTFIGLPRSTLESC